jgi:hypothetical protein
MYQLPGSRSTASSIARTASRLLPRRIWHHPIASYGCARNPSLEIDVEARSIASSQSPR